MKQGYRSEEKPFPGLSADGHLERTIDLKKIAELDRNEEYLLRKPERYQLEETALFQRREDNFKKILDLRRVLMPFAAATIQFAERYR